MIPFVCPFPALERVGLVSAKSSVDHAAPMRFLTFAGGSGFRAANAAQLAGGFPVAIGFAGGRLGALLQKRLDDQRVAHHLVHSDAPTRGHLIMLDNERGVTSEVPEAPPTVGPDDYAALLAVAHMNFALATRVAVFSDRDNVPRSEFWDAMLADAKARGIQSMVDMSGDALDLALKHAVFYAQFSLKGLQRRTEVSLQNDSAIVDEMRSLRDQFGVENICVTIGDEGALFYGPDGAWRVRPPVVSRYKDIGAGEGFLGAFAARFTLTGALLDSLAFAAAYAATSVAHDIPGESSVGEAEIVLRQTVVEPVLSR